MVLISLLTWLALIAYAVLIGDLLEPVAELLGVGVGAAGRKLLIIGAVMLISPMCFMRTLTALKICSLITVCRQLLLTPTPTAL